MLATRTTTQVAPFGEVTTRALEGNILEVVHRGHCGPAQVRAVLELTPDALRRMPGADWLLNMSAVTSTDPLASLAGGAIMRTFRARGGKRFVAVTPSPDARMIIATGAFAANIPFKVFATRDDALAFLRGEPAPPIRPLAKGPPTVPPPGSPPAVRHRLDG